MEELWNLCGSFMEKILDWNMEKPWSICEDLTRWKIIGWKISKRAKMEWYAKPTEGMEKMFRKIADWARTKSGKEVLTGVFWGFVGIIAVRLFCFLVCLATGYPADVWHIFG